MTDEQIIKALECHSNDYSFCMECPFSQREECSCELSRKTLDLINRQKAEIESLNRKLEASTVAKELLRIQSKGNADTAELYQGILKECIKEMVGEDNA